MASSNNVCIIGSVCTTSNHNLPQLQSIYVIMKQTPTTEIYTLSLHDALPISVNIHITIIELNALHTKRQNLFVCRALSRSEERFSRNAETELVCRLLLEKKN